MLKGMEEKAAGISHWKKLGKVKLGLKERANNTRCELKHQHVDACYAFYPKDVNYFVMDEKWHAKLGAKPQALEIMFPFVKRSEGFDIRRAMYKQNGTKACFTNDGITAKRMQKEPEQRKDPKTRQMVDVYKQIELPCPGAGCEFAAKCPIRGQLEFMIPGCGEVGTFFMKTGSVTSYTQMLATFQALEGWTQGRDNGLQGLRMILRRELVVFRPDINGTGDPKRVEKYVPKLEIDYDHLFEEDRRLLAPVMGKVIELPAPATEADLDTKDDDEPEAHEQPAGGAPTSFQPAGA